MNPSSDQARLLREAVAAFGRADFDKRVVCFEDGIGQVDDAEVLALFDEEIGESLDGLWARGWSPADVVHVVARQAGSSHAEMVALGCLADGRRRAAAGQRLAAAWQDQLDDLDGLTGVLSPDLRVLVEVIAVVSRLGAVPETMPRPGSPLVDAGVSEGRLDPRLLTRVRALLAKAESTEFDEEAEAFTAKAQELIARHAIDQALLDDAGGDRGAVPVTRRIHLDDPYLEAKAYLVAEVGHANRCRAVLQPDVGWVTAVGFAGDLDALELLVASLLSQATAAMLREGSRVDAAGRSRTRSFRRAFLLGFGQRIGQRLLEVADDTVAAAEEAGTALVPVFAARERAVEEATDEAFPDLRARSSSFTNGAGFAAGRTAAEDARLDPARPLRGQRSG